MSTQHDLAAALVTGGGRGLGEAIAHRLGRDGRPVGILDLDGETAARTARAVADAHGVPTHGVALDVRDRDAAEQAVATMRDALGAPGVLVNNAGVARDDLFYRMSEDDWDTVVDVHLKGTFLMSQAVQRHMPASGGRIVNVSSTSAHGNVGQANYAAAKAGIVGLTRTMALELGPRGITVNAIAPGFVPTDMSREAAVRMGIEHDDLVSQAASGMALRRVGRPEDVAGAVSFLTGPDAAFVCGAILYVAGHPWG